MLTDTEKTAYEAVLNLSGALQSALIAALVAAVVIVCVVEIIKIPTRALFHFLLFAHWLRANAAWSTPSEERRRSFRLGWFDLLRGNRYSFGITFSLPGELFMKQVENIGREALENLRYHSDTIELFAAGAPPDAFVAADQAERSGEASPSGLAAQEKLAAAVERNMDDLQLKIAFWWPTLLRLANAVFGIAVVTWAARTFVPREQLVPILVPIIIGLVAGYLAAVINDVIGILRGWRSSLSS